MQAKLRVVNGKASRSEVPLKLPVVIGRSSDAGLKIKHQLISRAHCELYEKDGYLYLRDNGSLNGTYMAGQRINEVLLNPGDQFTVGPLTFEAVYEPPATEPLAEPTTSFDSQTTLNAPAPGAMDFSALEDAVVNPADGPLEFPNFEESSAASSVEATLDFIPNETIHEKTPTVAAEIAWPTEDVAPEPEVPPQTRDNEVDMSWLSGAAADEPPVEPVAEMAEEQGDFFAVQQEGAASADEVVEPAETFQPFADEVADEAEVSAPSSSNEVDMSWLTGAATEEPPVEPSTEVAEEQVDFFAEKVEDVASAEEEIESIDEFPSLEEESAVEPIAVEPEAQAHIAPEEQELGLDFSEPQAAKVAADELEAPTSSASEGDVDFSWLAAAEPATPAVPPAIDFSGISTDSGQSASEQWPLDLGENTSPAVRDESDTSGNSHMQNLLQEPSTEAVDEISSSPIDDAWAKARAESSVEEHVVHESTSELSLESVIPTAVSAEPPVDAVFNAEESAAVENADQEVLEYGIGSLQEVSDLHVDKVQAVAVEPIEVASTATDEGLESVTQTRPESIDSTSVAEVANDLDLNLDSLATPVEEPPADVLPVAELGVPPLNEFDSASLPESEPAATVSSAVEWSEEIAKGPASEVLPAEELDYASPQAEEPAELSAVPAVSWPSELPFSKDVAPEVTSSEDSSSGPDAVWPLAGEISPLQSEAADLAAAEIVSDSSAAIGTEGDWNQPLSPVDESAAEANSAPVQTAAIEEYNLQLSEPAAEIRPVADEVLGFGVAPVSDISPTLVDEIQPAMAPEPVTDWLSPAAWQPIDTSSVPPIDFGAGIVPSPEILPESPAEESPVFGDNAGEITASPPDSFASPASPDVPACNAMPVDADPPLVPEVSEVQFTDTDVITPADEAQLVACDASTEEVPQSWVEEPQPSPTEGDNSTLAGAVAQGTNEEYTNGFGHGIFDSPATSPVSASADEQDVPPAFPATSAAPTWSEAAISSTDTTATAMAAAGPAQFTVFGRLRPHSPPVEPRPFQWVAAASAAVIQPPVWDQPAQAISAETTAESWEDLADIEEIAEVSTVAVEVPAVDGPVEGMEAPVEDVAAWLQEPAIPADPWDTPAFASTPEADPPSFTAEIQPTTEEATLLWNAPPANTAHDFSEPESAAASSLELSDLEPMAANPPAESPSLEFAPGAPDDVGPILSETTTEWQAPADIAFEEPPPADFFSEEPIAEIQSLDEAEDWEDWQPIQSNHTEPADWPQDAPAEPAEQAIEWADSPAPPAVSTYAAPPASSRSAEAVPAAKSKSRWWWPFGSKTESSKPAKTPATPPPMSAAVVPPPQPEMPPAVPLAMDDVEEDEPLTIDMAQLAEPELIEAELVEPELIGSELIEPELIAPEPGMATAEFSATEEEPPADLGETGTFAPLPPAPLHSRRTVTEMPAFPPMPVAEEPDGAFKPINFEEELASESRKSGGKYVDDWLLAEPHPTPPAKPPLDDDLNDFLKKLK